MLPKLFALLVLFAEPGFPSVDVTFPLPLSEIEGAVVTTTVAELEEALKPGRILVWRHGSAFPADAWPSLLKFLEDGGSMLYLGGEPFTRPVTGEPGSRIIQPSTLSMLKELRLNRSYREDAGAARLRHLSHSPPLPPERILREDTWISILEPRLSDEKRISSEDGSDGPRDGIVRPISHVHRKGEDPRFPCAAGSVAIDRLRGRFAGGRWVFWLLSEAPSESELENLLAEASRPAFDFRIDPTFGCFHEGETPSVIVIIERPGAEDVIEHSIDLEVAGPDGRIRRYRNIEIKAGTSGSVLVQLDKLERPGFYRVTGRAEGFDPATTGYWIFDPNLFTSGDELSFDNYTLLRNGMPEPVVGTTVMSETVHRQFLFEPNAAVWDDTFAELASLDINLVRTGVWTGFKRISPDPGIVDESWLRALEAFYLSARRHGIPVLFTFFAFTPESYGGISPYFDPISIEAQQAYLSAVATRFANAKEMFWDLINEPSFASPSKLWRCRPNGDRYEETAFLGWLRKRYSLNSADPDDQSWRDVVRTRWRLLPDEEIGLPRDSDFVDYYYIEDHHPYRAKEYLHFAQDAFEDWILEMTGAIREAGSNASITVGQDEGGLVERPTPLFHHQALDFTSMHTWWNNDALLWDGLMAKAPGKPLLISETGIMQRELLSGESLRDLQGYADLLSRKIGYSFAAGAFGMVEWIYDVNPYMPSDNEVAIGLKRTDGSYKPEHRVLREFAAFMARNRARFRGLREPGAVMVVPFSDMFGARNLQTSATRKLINGVVNTLNQRIQIISEFRTASDLRNPHLILLPACNGISEGAWEDLITAVRNGSLLHCSGWFETDDAGFNRERLGVQRRALALVERVPPLEADILPELRYPLEAVQTGFAASHGEFPRFMHIGEGRIRHYPTPLEWASGHELQTYYYGDTFRAADLEPGNFSAPLYRPGLGIYFLDFRDVTLLVAVNETSSGQSTGIFRIGSSGSDPVVEITVPAGVARMFLLDRTGRIVDSSH